MRTLTVQDKTAIGKVLHAFPLAVDHDHLTVAELIRRRVLQEVERYNQQPDGAFRGLIEPEHAERTLHGYRLVAGRQIDAESQVSKALQAFEENGFILVVNDQQVDNLATPISLEHNTQITFMKLVPLVGG